MYISSNTMRASRRYAVAACLSVFWIGAANAQGTRAPESFADLAQAKLPSVVTITATGNGDQQGGNQRGDNGSRDRGFGIPGFPQFELPPGLPFEDFLKRFGPGENMPEGPVQPQNALGSGFVVDPTGYIVTNNHVVREADEITVVLQDDREFTAEIVGTDPKTDLALLKIQSDTPLPAVTWGNSDQMRIGDWVMAIGNPFGLGGTVTAGIISARARDIGAGPYDDFLQTDAAINRGNSGGPMFNMAGEVIGVNTAIFSQTGGNIGIGFAVPSAVAQPIIQELREHGKVTRGWLGVSIQPVSPEIAQALGIDKPEGALVAQVTPNSPAAKAGIDNGDVIVQFDGKNIEGPRDLSRLVAQVDIGSQVGITVWRDGERRTLNTTVAELDEARTAAASQDGGSQQQQTGPLGLTLASLTPELKERFDLNDAAKGAVVVDVAPNSPAATRGFRAGDLITRAGRQGVEKPDDVVAAIEQARKANQDSILVLRNRDGNSIFVPLPVDSQAG